MRVRGNGFRLSRERINANAIHAKSLRSSVILDFGDIFADKSKT
jgi:hypothetical protein